LKKVGPALQRTATQGLRAALRPGNEHLCRPVQIERVALSCVTRCDQRVGEAFCFAGTFRRAAVLLAVFRDDLGAVLLDAFVRELVAIVSFHTPL
jgi:hypothetical protein